jgi:hypothetical protein
VLAVILVGCGGLSASPATTSSVTTAPTIAATSAPVSTASPAYSPTPRTSASMAWDPARNEILLFGGDRSNGPTNALDAWDGTAWRALTSLGPPSRDDGLLVADPDRGVVVLAGGRNGQAIRDDTWEWDGSGWQQIGVQGPPPRAHAAAAYDHKSKRMIVYGGVSETGTFHDTWAWNGTAWKQLDDVGIPGRIPNYMAWDPTLSRLLILAVDLDAPNADQTYPSELWSWTGDGWELIAKGGPSFSPLQQFVEGPRHPWLIDGGALQGTFSTREWTGKEWTSLQGAAPPVRNGQAVAFDPVRRQLVLFGGFVGQTVLGDTWQLDDGAWGEVRP